MIDTNDHLRVVVRFTWGNNSVVNKSLVNIKLNFFHKFNGYLGHWQKSLN